jgi:uncharacterized protein YjlB
MRREVFWLEESGKVPNNPQLPVIVVSDAFEAGSAEAAEAMFARHGWPPAWRDGIYPYPHFHTTAHEALAVARGEVTVLLGGEGGARRHLSAGDAVVLPAGVAHQRLHGSEDLLVVGAYPPGQKPDEIRPDGSRVDIKAAREAIARLPDPPCNPMNGEVYPHREGPPEGG